MEKRKEKWSDKEKRAFKRCWNKIKDCHCPRCGAVHRGYAYGVFVLLWWWWQASILCTDRKKFTAEKSFF